MGKMARSPRSRLMRSLRRTIWIAVASMGIFAAVAVASIAIHTLRLPNAAVAQDGSTNGETEPTATTKILTITITPHGFEPRDATVPAGQYLLKVRNVCGTADLAVTARGLIRDVLPGYGKDASAIPNPVTDIAVPLGLGTSYVERVVLVPGVVTVDDAEHPGWSCRINVTP